MEAEYVRSETVVVMQDILRKYPDRASAVIPSLHRCLKRVEDASGRAAVIWMLGEYGHLIDDAPYLLEPLIDGIETEESASVRCELLTATLKLFFKRPPEVQKMMGRLFKASLADGVNSAVRDRALMYYRLLRADVSEAAQIIGGDRAPVTEFLEEQAPEVLAAIWSEFNSLSVVYNKPSQDFVAQDHLVHALDAVAAAGARAAASATDDSSLLQGGTEDGAIPQVAPSVATAQPTSVAAPAPAPAVDLLGADDLLGWSPPPVAPAPAYAAAPAPVASAALGLSALYSTPAPAPAPVVASSSFFRSGVSLDASVYQSKWGALPPAGAPSQVRGITGIAAADIEGRLRNGSVYPIASGDVGTAFKFYCMYMDFFF